METIIDHIGVIIDGNRRWAREKGLPTLRGHRRGVERVRQLRKSCQEKGIKILTVYVFSTENWKRTEKEVTYLMKLIKEVFTQEKEVKQLHKDGVKVRFLGQKKGLSLVVQKGLNALELLTKNNKNMIFNIALNYGGRLEIIHAVKKIIRDKYSVKKVNEKLIAKNLWTGGLPDPDLIIRTGGEQRLSNFLTWQSVYSELYFIKKYWPDFTTRDLNAVLQDYTNRHRRFGK